MLLFSFNISDLHAAKKGGGGGSLKCMCDLCDCVLQVGIMTHSFSLNWQKNKRSNLKLSFTVVHNMECDEC